jgi:hypothetical protein
MTKIKVFYLISLAFLIILLVSASITITKPGKAMKTANENAMQFHSRFLFSDSSQVAYFECDDFVSDALANYTIATITGKYSDLLHLTQERVVNRHDSTVIDTIYTFSNPGNKIQIYRAKQNEFLFTFQVRDSLFNLMGDVKTGMSKDAFSFKFNITEPIVDKVQMANSEDSMRFIFYFEKNRLMQINSYLYLD